MIACKNISKSFKDSHGPKVILDDVSFEIPTGKITAIFGPNGCGKSTLMNVLSGLDGPTSGSFSGFDHRKNGIGYVFQDYRKSLLPWLTVAENILFPLKLRRIKKAEQRAQLSKLIALTNFTVDLKQRVQTLSGGQAQMVCLLRALVVDPKLLILDEPFSALDYEKTLSLRQKVMEIAAALKLTVIFISHDIEEALYIGDQVVFFSRAPTKVQAILPIPLARPRDLALLASPEFTQLKLEALKIFQHTVGDSFLI